LLVTNGDMTSMCFKGIVIIATDVSKSKTDQFLLVGTGDTPKTIDGIPYKGNCYLDSKGTLKKDTVGNLLTFEDSFSAPRTSFAFVAMVRAPPSVAFIAPVENLSGRVIVLTSPCFALYRCHNLTSLKYKDGFVMK
jgi:hypothetical protein